MFTQSYRLNRRPIRPLANKNHFTIVLCLHRVAVDSELGGYSNIQDFRTYKS